MTEKLKNFAGEAIPGDLLIATENEATTIEELHRYLRQQKSDSPM